MSLKLLVAAALAAVDIADDTVFSAEMKTTLALAKLRDLQLYLEAAPKTAVELVAGCEPVHNYGYVEPGGYLFTRRQLEDFAQTAFAAGLTFRGSYAKAEKVPCEPVHDYERCTGTQRAGDYDQIPAESAPAATPIRTSDAAVDLQFSDGTCVTVRVVGK